MKRLCGFYKIRWMGYLFFFFVSNVFSAYVGADVCNDWFKSHRLKTGEDCLLQCVSLETDMDTFHCSDLCDKLCSEPITTKMLFNTSLLYPSLVKKERAVVSKHPKKAMTAYLLSLKAEKICYSLFKRNETNDVSDACRHFIWAGLLYEKFGFKFSSTVLNAHEADPKQPRKEKAMDISNNNLGLATAEKLLKKKKKKKLTKKELIKAFKKQLKKGRVVILEAPKGKK